MTAQESQDLASAIHWATVLILLVAWAAVSIADRRRK